MKVGELEEANAALEDMNTQMEATSLQAQSQRDELQAQIASLMRGQEQAASLEKQRQDLKLTLQVLPFLASNVNINCYEIQAFITEQLLKVL